MPQGTESLMHSFNLGPVHFIGFSTELYYFLNYGMKPLVRQYEWLRNDLIEANKPENRYNFILPRIFVNKFPGLIQIESFFSLLTGSFVHGS